MKDGQTFGKIAKSYVKFLGFGNMRYFPGNFVSRSEIYIFWLLCHNFTGIVFSKQLLGEETSLP